MTARLEPIVPKTVDLIVENPRNTVRKLSLAAREEANAIEKEYAKTTATWSAKNKPRFTVIARATRGGGISVKVTTKDTPFVFIDQGTKIRFRSMTHDFVAKTKPGVLGSFIGRGGPAGFDVKPGIQARRFSELIAEKRQNEIVEKVITIFAGAGVTAV